MSLTRRHLLALLPGGAATLTLGGAAGLAGSAGVALAAQQPDFTTIESILPEAPLSLDDWEAMSPVEMARRSPLAVAGAAQCQAYAKEIQDTALRKSVLALLDDPTPSFGAGHTAKAMVERLEAAGFAEASLPLPPLSAALTSDDFLAAPGSHWKGHHAYPGGLALHVGPNTAITLGIAETYIHTYGFAANTDILIAAQLLHDCMKPWALQWQADGSCHAEGVIAGTSAHHVLSLTEVVFRGFPDAVILALACAHGTRAHPKTGKGPKEWLAAAALLADRPTPTVPDNLPVECFIVHHGDGDWRFTSTAATACRRFMERLAISHYGIPERERHSKRFNALRNAICGTLTMERMYVLLQTQGEEAVIELAARIVLPLA